MKKNIYSKVFFLIFIAFLLLGISCRDTKILYQLPFDSHTISSITYDNKIYKPKYQFTYSLNISKYDTIFSIQVGNSGREYKIIPTDKNQKNEIYLYVFPDSCNQGPLCESQSMIAYKYLLNGKLINGAEITGIMENENYLYVHPPRTYLDILEYCPWPEIPMPLLRKKEWETHGTVYDGFNLTPWNYSKQPPNAYNTKKYQIVKDTTLYFQQNQEKCYIINGQFFDEKNDYLSKAQFVFNEKYGFLSSDYFTISNHRIILKLRSIKKL